jgi:hypothetical protein
MNGTGARHGWIVAICAGAMLSACGDPEPAPSSEAKAAAAAPAKARRVTDNMVAAAAAGKSAAAVGVYFTLGNAPTVNTALPVEVAILPHQDFSTLRARFDSPGGGLTLMSGDLVGPIENVKAEAPLEHKLVLMPQKDGVFVVTANLETAGTEGMVSRIFSIPVIVAPAEAAPAETPPPPAPAPAPN